MEYTKRYYILIFCVILLSCNDELRTARNLININDSEINQFHNSSDLFKNIDIIPIETNDSCLIGSANKVVMTHNRFYIMDNNDKSVTIFTDSGKFITKIKRVGLGHGEYIDLADFTVTQKGDILMLDSQKKAVLCYDSVGLYQNKYSLTFYADALELLNDTTLVFNGSSTGSRVIVWNVAERKVINEYLDYDKRLACRISKPLIPYNCNVYFMRNFVSSVYKVTPDSLSIEWDIDFGKRNLNVNDLILSEYGFYVPPTHCATTKLFFETDKYILFNFECEDLNYLPYYVYYSKVSGIKKIVNYDSYNDDILFNKYPPIINNTSTSGEFIALINPYLMLKNHAEYDTSKMSNVELGRWEILKYRLQNVTVFSNPIIVIYKLKDF